MDFWSELVKVVISNGIFAILFVYLLFYQLKDSQKREQAYRKTIEELSTHLIIIEKVRDEVNELKNMLQGEENEKF